MWGERPTLRLVAMPLLWDDLTSLDQESQLSSLSHSVFFGINLFYEKVNAHGGDIACGLTRRMAKAVDLDVVEAEWETLG